MRRKQTPLRKRPQGRPRKEPDRIEDWQLVRAAAALADYGEARLLGQKHRVAVTEAVNAFKQRYRDIAISETELRRILAKARPKDSRYVLVFDRIAISDKELANRRWWQEQIATLNSMRGLKFPLPNIDLARTSEVYTIRWADRPNYPRSNRRDPSA